MSRWFRHYAGMARDDKLVRVSIKSKQSVERVVWVWAAVLESAAEIDDEGRYEVEAEEIARFLRCPATKIRAVLDALVEMGRMTDGRVTKWDARQFKSDRSNARVAEFRERKRNGGNGAVTLPERHGNSPETETETEVPLSKDNGAKFDSDQVFWDGAKAFVQPESKNPGAIIGKWVRDHGKDATAQAITRAQLERPAQRLPFIAGCLKKSKEAELEYPIA